GSLRVVRRGARVGRGGCQHGDSMVGAPPSDGRLTSEEGGSDVAPGRRTATSAVRVGPGKGSRRNAGGRAWPATHEGGVGGAQQEDRARAQADGAGAPGGSRAAARG